MATRILAGFILLYSILALPWWVSFILAAIFMTYFSLYIEAPALALLADLLYGAGEAKFYGITLVSFFLTLAVFIIIEMLKNKLRPI